MVGGNRCRKGMYFLMVDYRLGWVVVWQEIKSVTATIIMEVLNKVFLDGGGQVEKVFIYKNTTLISKVLFISEMMNDTWVTSENLTPPNKILSYFHLQN